MLHLCVHVSAKYTQRRPLSAKNSKERRNGKMDTSHRLQSCYFATSIVEGECRIIIELHKHLELNAISTHIVSKAHKHKIKWI